MLGPDAAADPVPVSAPGVGAEAVLEQHRPGRWQAPVEPVPGGVPVGPAVPAAAAAAAVAAATEAAAAAAASGVGAGPAAVAGVAAEG